MQFIQTYYFFVVTALSFLTGLSVCFALTGQRLWPKGLVLPVIGLGLTVQTVYLPIPGSDLLLIGGIGVMLLTGSVLGLAARMIVDASRRLRAARLV